MTRGSVVGTGHFAQPGATLIDTKGLEAFRAALQRESRVALVILTRLAVTYEVMLEHELRQVVQLMHARGVPVYVDDADGARVCYRSRALKRFVSSWHYELTHRCIQGVRM